MRNTEQDNTNNTDTRAICLDCFTVRAANGECACYGDGRK